MRRIIKLIKENNSLWSVEKAIVSSQRVVSKIRLVGWLVEFYGISTFVDYLTLNPFLCKLSVLFQTIQFSMNTQFNCQNISISNYSFIQTVLIQLIQFSISTYFVYTQ